MTNLQAQAFALIPEHAEYTNAIGRVTSEIRKNTTPVPGVGLPDFAELALSGGEFPADVLSSELNRQQLAHNQIARGKMLKTTQAELERRRIKSVQDNSAVVFEFLGRELTSLVEEVVETAEVLGTLRDGQRILDHGTDEQIMRWRDAKVLVTRYKELRELQLSTFRQCTESTDVHKFYSVGLLRNSLDYSDYWVKQRSEAYTSRASNDQDQGVVNYNNWLTTAGDKTIQFKREILPTEPNQHVAFLLDLCLNHELWVPNSDQLLSAWEAANGTAQPVSYDRLKGMEESREQYYEITGSTPANAYTSSGTTGHRKIKKRSLAESYLNHVNA